MRATCTSHAALAPSELTHAVPLTSLVTAPTLLFSHHRAGCSEVALLSSSLVDLSGVFVVVPTSLSFPPQSLSWSAHVSCGVFPLSGDHAADSPTSPWPEISRESHARVILVPRSPKVSEAYRVACSSSTIVCCLEQCSDAVNWRCGPPLRRPVHPCRPRSVSRAHRSLVRSLKLSTPLV